MSKITDAMGSRPTGDDSAAAADPAFEARCPILFAFLTSREKINGKPRQTSTLMLIAEEGLWKGGLRDRDANASLWTTADSVQGVLDGLEKALGSPPVDWRRPVDPGRNTLNRKRLDGIS